MAQSNFNFNQAMEELATIDKWFRDDDIDLEEGLKKLRRAKELIVLCQDRLKKIENEYQEIKAGMTEVLSNPTVAEAEELEAVL